MEKCLSPLPPFSDFLLLDSEKESKSMSDLFRPLLPRGSMKVGVPKFSWPGALDGVCTWPWQSGQKKTKKQIR